MQLHDRVLDAMRREPKKDWTIAALQRAFLKQDRIYIYASTILRTIRQLRSRGIVIRRWGLWGHYMLSEINK